MGERQFQRRTQRIFLGDTTLISQRSIIVILPGWDILVRWKKFEEEAAHGKFREQGETLRARG